MTSAGRARVGLVVNPVAGLGGRVGLGGTDGPDRRRQALALGARPLAGERATAALRELRARLGTLPPGAAPGGRPAPWAVPGPDRRPAFPRAVPEADRTAAGPAPSAPRSRAATTGDLREPTGRDAISDIGPDEDATVGAGLGSGVPVGSGAGSGAPGAAVAQAGGGCPGAELEVVTAAGAMGADSATAAGLAPRVVHTPEAGRETSVADTVAAVRAIVADGVDLLLFAGGDGTARDVLAALHDVRHPVLGVPTGVKMHSAVFGVTPRAAGEVAAAWLARSGAARLRDAEVMDRDEDGLRAGRVASRLHGWLPVPHVPARVQQRKTGSVAGSPEAVGGIALEVAERVGDGLLALGPGSTTRAVAAALGADVSLAGVDVLALRPGHPARVVVRDAGEDALLAAGPCWIAVSPIGGQGFLLGRGNQQISPRVLRAAGGRERLLALCTEQKLAALGGRPLLLDTGDDALDAEWSGHLPVITGWHRTALYHLTT
ncbi:NAD(+)/NADH kinase [Streptomyces sp. NPDC001292]|uniref:NAD(+)/NADH kinase n=1 Tax=Streptomyces sp. NPDC001292 TaxID=3364558 RepID=UPI0036A5EE75